MISDDYKFESVLGSGTFGWVGNGKEEYFDEIEILSIYFICFAEWCTWYGGKVIGSRLLLKSKN